MATRDIPDRTLGLLYSITTNILRFPTRDRYRTLNASRKLARNHVFAVSEALTLLQQAGFLLTSDDADTPKKLHFPDECDLQPLRDLRKLVARAQKDRKNQEIEERRKRLAVARMNVVSSFTFSTIPGDLIRVIALFIGPNETFRSLTFLNRHFCESLLHEDLFENFSTNPVYHPKGDFERVESFLARRPEVMTWRAFFLCTRPIRVRFVWSIEEVNTAIPEDAEMESIGTAPTSPEASSQEVEGPLVEASDADPERELVRKDVWTWFYASGRHLSMCGVLKDFILETEREREDLFDHFSLGDEERVDMDVTFRLDPAQERGLRKLIEFTKYHFTEPMAEIPKPLPGLIDDHICLFDLRFLEIDQSLLIDLVTLSNVLDLKPLLDLTCGKIASMLKGKSPEQIREMFGIENTFTPEEEAKIREENRWCEEE